MNIKDSNIGTRLAIGITVAVALLAAMVWVGVSRLHAVKGHLEEITQSQQPKISAAKELRDNLRSMDIAVRNVVLLNDEKAMLDEVQALESLRLAFDRTHKELLASTDSEQAKALLAKVQAAMLAMVKPVDKAVRLGSANKAEEATRVLLEEVHPLEQQAMAAIQALTKLQLELGEQAVQQADATYRSALALLVSIGSIAGVMLCLFGWLLVRSITRPLQRAVSVARAVAAGDLTVRIDACGRNETGQLLQALKDMQGSLVQLVTGVREQAENVATGSSEISQGNNDLAHRTEEQASALQQAVSSMAQLGTTVGQNADSARRADGLAQEASSVALRGGAVVAQVVDTMRGINDNSKKISEIIGVINGITFQTNILALNAGVEAARAGDQGRGFAVVASEVRNLSQRSADAAKEIASLINASVERVERGSAQVDQARSTMAEIVASVAGLTGLMKDISSSSAEQSSDVGRVSQAVTLMDHATQQNAALVEQSAAAAESLKHQAQHLVQAVSVFRVPA